MRVITTIAGIVIILVGILTGLYFMILKANGVKPQESNIDICIPQWKEKIEEISKGKDYENIRKKIEKFYPDVAKVFSLVDSFEFRVIKNFVVDDISLHFDYKKHFWITIKPSYLGVPILMMAKIFPINRVIYKDKDNIYFFPFKNVFVISNIEKYNFVEEKRKYDESFISGYITINSKESFFGKIYCFSPFSICAYIRPIDYKGRLFLEIPQYNNARFYCHLSRGFPFFDIIASKVPFFLRIDDIKFIYPSRKLFPNICLTYKETLTGSVLHSFVNYLNNSLPKNTITLKYDGKKRVYLFLMGRFPLPIFFRAEDKSLRLGSNDFLSEEVVFLYNKDFNKILNLIISKIHRPEIQHLKFFLEVVNSITIVQRQKNIIGRIVFNSK